MDQGEKDIMKTILTLPRVCYTKVSVSKLVNRSGYKNSVLHRFSFHELQGATIRSTKNT